MLGRRLGLFIVCVWMFAFALAGHAAVLSVQLTLAPQVPYSCQDLLERLAPLTAFAVTLTCSTVPETTATPEAQQVMYAVHVSLHHDQLVVRVSNLQRRGAGDFEELAWNMHHADPQQLPRELSGLLQFLRDYHVKSPAFKTFLLCKAYTDPAYLHHHYALDASWVVLPTYDPTVPYRDADLERTLPVCSAPTRKRNFLRASWEIAAFLGIGQGLYYVFEDTNIVDWDYSTDDFPERLTTWNHWKFDDNRLSLNLGHVYSGVLPYTVGRSNGFTIVESFLATLLFSSIWEIAAEYREVVSVNDQIVTTAGGVALGEPLHQMGRVWRQQPGVIAQGIAALVDPVGTLNYWLDGRAHPYSDFDAPPEQWAEFTTQIGYALTQDIDDDGHGASYPHLLLLGVQGSVLNAGVHVPGTANQWIGNTVLSQLLLQAKFSPEALEEAHFITRTILSGYYWKNLTVNSKDQLQGYSLIIGLANGLEYRSRQDGEETDVYGVVNVIGAALELNAFHKNYRLHYQLDAFGNFALIRPFALDAAVMDNTDLRRITASLFGSNARYSYATGYTIHQALTLSNYGWEVGVSLRYTQFYGLNSRELDRFGERILREATVRDSAMDLHVWGEKHLSKKSRVRLEIEVAAREGSLRWWRTRERQRFLQDDDIIPSFMLIFARNVP